MKKIVLIVMASFTIMACTKTEKMDNRKDIATMYYQILDSGDVSQLDELLASSLIDHDGHGGNAVEEIKGLTMALNNGFTNSKHDMEVVELINEDMIFVRWRMTAKHTDEFFGQPASNNQVNFVGHDLIKVKDQKIIEIWHVENLLGMFEQMKTN